MNLLCTLVIFYFPDNNHFVSFSMFFYLYIVCVFVGKCLNDIALRIRKQITCSTKFNVHQSVPKYNQTFEYESIKSSNFDLPLSQVLHPCLSGASIIVQIMDNNQVHNEKVSRTVDDYFQ